MSLRDHPFAHTGLKVVSVALAVLLWMMVSSQRASVERGLRIPLELQNLPGNLEMVEPPQESVDVACEHADARAACPGGLWPRWI